MSLLTYHSWHVTLDISLSTCHSQHSFSRSPFQHIILDVSFLTYQSWHVTLSTFLSGHVTLDKSPSPCYSSNATLNMSLSGYVTIEISLSTCHVQMPFLTCHYRHVTFDHSLSTCHSHPFPLDISLSTCHSQHVTLNKPLLKYHSRLGTLNMSFLTYVYHFPGNLERFWNLKLFCYSLTHSLTLTRPRGAFAPKKREPKSHGQLLVAAPL